MKSNTDLKKAKFRFAGLYSITVLLVVIIFSAFSNTSVPAKPGEKHAAADKQMERSQLLEADKVLHFRLQQLDEKFALALSNTKTGLISAETNILVENAERLFIKTIDSLEQAGMNYHNAANKKYLSQITSFFKKTLDSRRSMMNMYAGLTKEKKDVPADQQALVELQHNLAERDVEITYFKKQLQNASADRDKRIAELQRQVQVKQKAGNQNEISGYAAATGEDINQLRQRNANLKLAFNTLLTQNGVLNKSYNALFQQNKLLMDQLNEARKHQGGK